MNEDNTNWTSIDFYYKGFHVKKSVPKNVEAEDIIKTIDKYAELGFEPSWNKDTSQQQLNGKKSEDINTDTQECPIHNVQMSAKEGKWGKFYSHRLDSGEWCNGK